jgi:GntR family transcriptional regulator, transcriptional repressor for pyruvate dehydrogenase complex
VEKNLMGLIERAPKTWVRVAERLQTLILNKKLLPGNKLPPERVLCQEFGVSRTVLREAVKHLSAQGLVDEITGRGTFVSTPNLEALKKTLQVCLGWHAQAVLENLVELRRLIEVEIAGLAAAHADKGELQNLQQNVRDMELAAETNTRAYVRLDLEFHSRLARATHNELFVILFEAISSALVGTWTKLHQDRAERLRGVEYHKKILAALERRKPEEARRAARENIDSFRRDALAQATKEPSAVTSKSPSERRQRKSAQKVDTDAGPQVSLAAR